MGKLVSELETRLESAVQAAKRLALAIASCCDGAGEEGHCDNLDELTGMFESMNTVAACIESLRSGLASAEELEAKEPENVAGSMCESSAARDAESEAWAAVEKWVAEQD